MSTPRYVILGAAMAAAAVLAGCATVSENAAPAPSASGGTMNPSAEPPSSVPPSGPQLPPPVPPTTAVPPLRPPTTKPGAGEIVVTGQVEFVELEGGCLVLRTPSQTYELMGVDRETARHGARLTVRGRVRADVMTICQMGPVLEAIEARPA